MLGIISPIYDTAFFSFIDLSRFQKFLQSKNKYIK